MVPFWDRCTTLVYFSGDWDVHWGYGVLTHGQFSVSCLSLLTVLRAKLSCCSGADSTLLRTLTQPSCQGTRPATRRRCSVCRGNSGWAKGLVWWLSWLLGAYREAHPHQFIKGKRIIVFRSSDQACSRTSSKGRVPLTSTLAARCNTILFCLESKHVSVVLRALLMMICCLLVCLLVCMFACVCDCICVVACVCACD